MWRLFVAVFAMMQVMMYQAPLYVAAPGTLSADLRALLLWAAWIISIPVVAFSAAPMYARCSTIATRGSGSASATA